MDQLLPLALGLFYALSPPPEPPDEFALALARFPWPFVTELNADWSANHARWARDVAEWNLDRPWWPEYSRTADYRRDCWWLLRTAQNETWPTDECRREALEELRRMIGEDWYAAGRMPLPVPWDFWVFGG